MPRYFFDVDDGDRQTRDMVGMDLTGLDDVADETRRIVHDLAYAKLLGRRHRTFTATVRDARGATVYRGAMALTIEYEASGNGHM